jgi:integrase
MRSRLNNSFAASAPQGVHKDESLPFWGLRVSPKGRKSWVLDCRIHGKRTYISLGIYPVIDAKLAKKRALEKMFAIEQGQDPRTKKRSVSNTISELAKGYGREHLSGLKPSTLKDYTRHMRLFIESFGKREANSVTVEEAEEFITSYPSRVQANRMRSTLMSFYQWAIKKRKCSENPFKQVEKVKEGKRTELVNVETLKQILGTFQSEGQAKHHLFFLLIMRTGCRAGEAQKMKVKDLQGEIWLKPAENTKNGKPQRVWLGAEMISRLLALKRSDEFIFGERFGYRSQWERVRALCGAPNLRVHDLRRCVGSELLTRGANIKAVSALLGHSDTKITEDRYALYLSDSREEVQMIDGLFDIMAKE